MVARNHMRYWKANCHLKIISFFLFRNRDPGYFCQQSEEMFNAKDFEIWIVSDCRRKSDFGYFESNYSGRTKRIRIFASEETREKRGFVFESGIDDAETECGLDDEDNDFLLENSDESHPENVLRPLIQYLNNIGFVLWTLQTLRAPATWLKRVVRLDRPKHLFLENVTDILYEFVYLSFTRFYWLLSYV